MFAATLVGGGPLLASQAAASAVLVATLQPPDSNFDFTRAIDALVGAATALVVGSLFLPGEPDEDGPRRRGPRDRRSGRSPRPHRVRSR